MGSEKEIDSKKGAYKMSKKEIASSLLRMLTKQGFSCKRTKKYLTDNEFLSEKGNVTVGGKKFIFDYYCHQKHESNN